MGCLSVFTILIFLPKIHANIINIPSEVKETCNNPTADETGLKIDLQFDDSDYEMIKEDDIKKYRIVDPERFQQFDKIVKEKYEKGMFNHEYEVEKQSQNKRITPKRKGKIKILIVMPSSESPVKYSIVKRSLAINYDVFGIEHFNLPKTNATEIKFSKDPFKPKIPNFLKEINSLKINYNCTEEDLRGIGITAIKCTINQFGNSNTSYKDLLMNLVQIAAVWLFVYLVFAVPLWCIKGWCSCCLCCKFFKPQQTIHEAKNYLLLNPPGTLVTKKGGIIHYEPTEREKDCYEEFGHFIRTL